MRQKMDREMDPVTLTILFADHCDRGWHHWHSWLVTLRQKHQLLLHFRKRCHHAQRQVSWLVLKTTSVPVLSGFGPSLTVIKSHFDLFQEVDGEVYFVVCLCCCFNYFKIDPCFLFFLLLFIFSNPFTASASKISRLKVHRHPCKLYFLPLYHIYCQCYVF